LQSLHSPRQVSDLEKSSDVDRAAIENVIPVDVGETDRRQIHPATRDYAALDADIVEVFFLYGSAGFDLNETPAPVPAAMKHIDAHQHAVMLEHSLEDCRDRRVRDQLPRCADRLIQPAIAANLNAARKKLAGEQSHFLTLRHDRFGCSVRLCREFRLMYLPVQAFEALATRDEFGFADSHVSTCSCALTSAPRLAFASQWCGSHA
jgi:hypothetical protein